MLTEVTSDLVDRADSHDYRSEGVGVGGCSLDNDHLESDCETRGRCFNQILTKRYFVVAMLPLPQIGNWHSATDPLRACKSSCISEMTASKLLQCRFLCANQGIVCENLPLRESPGKNPGTRFQWYSVATRS